MGHWELGVILPLSQEPPPAPLLPCSLFHQSKTMNSPFPGMNPYLENPVFWAEVYHL
ncbi:DUF4058 family protein [Nostoc punctiforme]|uniref:DUF4058 family protein n=1 Tax=Nostoc punctiforme TaxID=272131 RepID=UPI0037C9F6DE